MVTCHHASFYNCFQALCTKTTMDTLEILSESVKPRCTLTNHGLRFCIDVWMAYSRSKGKMNNNCGSCLARIMNIESLIYQNSLEQVTGDWNRFNILYRASSNCKWRTYSSIWQQQSRVNTMG